MGKEEITEEQDKDLNGRLLRGSIATLKEVAGYASKVTLSPIDAVSILETGESPSSLGFLEIRALFDEIVADRKLEISKAYEAVGLTEIVITLPPSDRSLLAVSYMDDDKAKVDIFRLGGEQLEYIVGDIGDRVLEREGTINENIAMILSLSHTSLAREKPVDYEKIEKEVIGKFHTKYPEVDIELVFKTINAYNITVAGQELLISPITLVESEMYDGYREVVSFLVDMIISTMGKHIIKEEEEKDGK